MNHFNHFLKILIIINLIYLNDCQFINYYDKFGPGFGPQELPRQDPRFLSTYENNKNLIKNSPVIGEIRDYELSDSRCKELLTIGQFEEKVTVILPTFGKIYGRISYHCDHPNVPDREKPGYRIDSSINLPRIRGNVSVFLGIPYARPPTKENGLRFKPPQPPNPQKGYLVGYKYKPACPQASRYTGASKLIPEIDEDCLYLNIFTPFAANQVQTPYTVMVYIHGGGFAHGSGNTFPGYMLSMYQEVVVVTFNYRLGLFGFFATGDHHSPGNYGLLDQVALLNWVRDNIRYFNGDPEKIVLFGPGAGAASAGILAVSPLSKHLVKRVIAISGSAMADWAVETDFYKIQNNSMVTSRFYGCPEYDTERMMSCLSSKTYTIAISEVENEVGWLPFSPVLDKNTRNKPDQVLPELPEILARDKPLFDSYLAGLTRDEGVTKVLEDLDAAKSNFIIDQNLFMKKVQKYLAIYNETFNDKAILDAIEFFYSPWVDRTNNTLWRQGLVELYSDSWYVAGVDKALKTLIDTNVKSYLYVLNYTLQGLNLPRWYGVPHNSEYLLVSGAPFMDHRFYPSELNLEYAQWTEADRNMSLFFMASWANFAKYSNPTPNSILNVYLWKPVDRVNFQYLSVNATNQTNIMHYEYKQKQSQFWNSYIYKLVGYRPQIWPNVFEPLHEELRIYRTFTWAILIILVILVFLTVFCGCLYCRAISDRVGDANLGFIDLAATGTQYTAPSSKANSEIDLNIRSLNTSTSVKEPIFQLPNGQAKHTYPKSLSYNNRYAYNRVPGTSQF